MTRSDVLVNATAPELGERLDRMRDAERVATVVSFSPSQLRYLWELGSADPRPDGVLVSGGASSAIERYAGRNSLSLFSRFEKRFFLEGSRTYGCNVHRLGWLIGPGYFGVSTRIGGGLRFDYRDLPRNPPVGWPATRSNDTTLATPVYGRLVDEVVWVARDVMVGAAFRDGAPLNSHFALVRLPASTIGMD